MSNSLIGVPKDASIVRQIIEKTLTNGLQVEVYLVKNHRQYEAALFLEGQYKPGPPVPLSLEAPIDKSTYWMGMGPMVGLSQEEGEVILGTVNNQNRLHHCYFKDKWVGGGDE